MAMVAALKIRLRASSSRGMTVNLGTGRVYSVLEVVKACRTCRAGGRFLMKSWRGGPGDIASCYADPALARNCSAGAPKHDIDRMCEDSWRAGSR